LKHNNQNQIKTKSKPNQNQIKTKSNNHHESLFVKPIHNPTNFPLPRT
jgi:hypothetical protein